MDKSIEGVDGAQAEQPTGTPLIGGLLSWRIGTAAKSASQGQEAALADQEDSDAAGEDTLIILDDWMLPEEIEQVGDVGGQGDDTGGPEVAKKRSVWLSFEELRLAICADSAVKAFKKALAKRWRSEAVASEPPTPESEWRRLGDEALGLIPILAKPISMDGNSIPSRDGRESAEAVPFEAHEQHDMEAFQRKLSTLRQIVEVQQRQLRELELAKTQIDLASKSMEELALLAVKTLRLCHC